MKIIQVLKKIFYWGDTWTPMPKVDINPKGRMFLTPNEIRELAGFEGIKEKLNNKYNAYRGFLAPVFDSDIKPIQQNIKTDKCKCCGAKDYEEIQTGIFKCSYCGDITGSEKQDKYIKDSEKIYDETGKVFAEIIPPPPKPTRPSPSVSGF
jgi:ribosomal protein L37AE/L43A